MHRSVVLAFLLLAACGRRETVTGNWTGAARPDASANLGAGPKAGDPTVDEKSSTPPDAAPARSFSPDAAPPPNQGELQPPDAAPGAAAIPDTRPAAPDEPGLAPRDASPDLTDAHPCPDATPCG